MDRRAAYAAALRGADWLRGRTLPAGALLEPPEHPVRPDHFLYHFRHGSDVWHAVNALRVFRALGQDVPAVERFVRSSQLPGGGLPHWTVRPGLCTETTALASLVMPALRPSLVATLQRCAYPEGRWPTFIIDMSLGYELYMVGPSVAGFVLAALPGDDAAAPAARRYLEESVGRDGVWAAHEAFYATPFYPAHVCVRWLSDPRQVLRYALETCRDGGWGFGEPPEGEASVLPTALAILTILACGSPDTLARRTLDRAAERLLGAQDQSGSFPAEPKPETLWYTGRVYATAIAAYTLLKVARLHSDDRDR